LPRPKSGDKIINVPNSVEEISLNADDSQLALFLKVVPKPIAKKARSGNARTTWIVSCYCPSASNQIQRNDLIIGLSLHGKMQGPVDGLSRFSYT
ncbi:hypothetical protein PY99_13630, partial [Lacticaseibacillus rhamnosus]